MSTTTNKFLKKNYSSLGTLPKLLVVAVMFSIIALIIFKQYSQPSLSTIPAKTSVSKELLTELKSSVGGESKLRGYAKSEEFFGSLYPTQITALDDETLSSFACGLYMQIECSYEGCTYYPDGSMAAESMPPVVESWLKPLNEKIVAGNNDARLHEAEVCTSEELGAFVVYFDGNYKFSVAENDAFELGIEIPATPHPYLACRHLLQVHKSGEVDLECGSGDGPSSQGWLYRVNASNKTVKLLKNCTMDAEANQVNCN